MRKLLVLITLLNVFSPSSADEAKPAATLEEVKRYTYGCWLIGDIQGAESFCLMKQYAGAINPLLDAMNVAGLLGYPDQEMHWILADLGSAYQQTGKYAEAEESYKELIEIEKRLNKATDQSMTLLVEAQKARETAGIPPLKDSILTIAQKTPLEDIRLNPTPGYTRLISASVAKCWHRPSQLVLGRSVVHFTVQRDGSFSETKLTEVSGQETLNQAALEAVAKAAPLPPLEPGVKDISVLAYFDLDKHLLADLWFVINKPSISASDAARTNKRTELEKEP